MNDFENQFEQIVAGLNIDDRPNTEHKDALRQQMLAACKESSSKDTARRIQPDWSRIMKSNITKTAAAAIIVIAALAGIYRFTGSIDGASIVFADVQNAFITKAWVHLKYDNGTESWYDLKTGDHCHTQLYSYGKSYVYINRTKNLRQRYTPYFGKHIDEDIPTIYPDNYEIPAYESKTAWETIIGPWEKSRNSKYHAVEIHDDTSDGNRVIRFDIYYIDALNRRILQKQLWADPVTKLPVKIQEHLTSQQQKDQSRESVTGTFFFPEVGPSSIYDLGVSRDLPIGKSYDKFENPSIEELTTTAKHYYDNFPKICRAVIWQNDYKYGMIEVIWRDGEKICFNHYSTVGQVSTEHPLSLPTDVEGVLAWANTQPPIDIYMDDGDKSYQRTYHPSFEKYKVPKVRVTRSWRRGLPEWAHFIEENWEYMDYDIKRFSYIDDSPESLSQYIGIKTESGDIRRDYYIDPENDYLQVQNIWWKLREGQWQKEREYIAAELTQLPEGQWYVSKRKLIIYPDPERGTSGSESNYTISITFLKEDQFPPDTFNGEKLMEGAEIETY